MTTTQERHLAAIQTTFAELVNEKYRRGAREHAGELLDVPSLLILDYAIEEAVDQVVYLLSLKEKLSQELPHARP
jgi:hypothetical protein